jgi:hypothetical protein
MSRLESMIRRLTAQRACLNAAAEMVKGLDGMVLEVGLGNGRTYDHLRELFPERDIYVCEKNVGAHPDCIPPDDRLLLGDARETLPEARPWMEGKVALANVDVGNGIIAQNAPLAAAIMPLIVPLVRGGGIVASDLSFDLPELAPLPLPDGISPGRYHLYRRV